MSDSSTNGENAAIVRALSVELSERELVCIGPLAALNEC